ncbi:MAG: SusD/RagB family nutrient-binding outer membrane lipoprotein [Sulfurimonas sp.]|nr:SusD/RagB family nutrient-binding outer membrane lipoprotein [Sulfurimonas sp.]
MLSKKVKTKNISTAINKLATENEISESKLHFNIDAVETYIKTVADNDFNLYIDDPMHYYSDFDKIIYNQVEFKQLYSITIKDDYKSIIELKYDINYSENNVNPYIILHPDSKIPYTKYKPKDIYLLMLKELNSIKAKNKILIKIFDNLMKEKLKSFIKHLYKGNFTKKIKLPLFTGIDPEVRRNSKLIRRYLQKGANHQVIEVDSGEVLVEFIKPVFGKNGLSAFGEIVDNNNKDNKNDLECRIDSNSIEIIENDDKKIYKSKKQGFVHIDEKDFYIDNKIKMQQLSRVHDSVTKDEANNIEINISQEDTTIDSLGEGVHLTSETIHIKGHVGMKSVIRAVNLEIDGATHQDSLQEAKFAEINRHKGKLRCHSAKIKLLEGGEVHATNVEIESSLGGSVYAENVTINVVKQNLKVYASNSITVKRIMGEDNLFKINYKDIPTLNSRYNFLKKDIDELKYTLEGAMKHTPTQIPILQDKIKKLKEQQGKIVNAVKSAKITIQDPLRGLNTIIFTIDDEHELTFKTDAESYEPFYLEESGDTITLHPTNKKITIES